MACKVKEELLEKEVRARAGNGNAAGCVNGVLDFGGKVFQATNRRDPCGSKPGESTRATDKKEDERNVDEILRKDAEQDAGRGRTDPGRVRVDHRTDCSFAGSLSHIPEGWYFRRVLGDRS